MGKFSSVKAAFFARVHGNLRKISVAQSKIRDFENSLAMLKEALAAQKKQFSELDHVKMLPEAYAACLKEIARRVRYGRRFSDRIQSMAEELAQMRDDEVNFSLLDDVGVVPLLTHSLCRCTTGKCSYKATAITCHVF
jgi:hypothetical protein